MLGCKLSFVKSPCGALETLRSEAYVDVRRNNEE